MARRFFRRNPRRARALTRWLGITDAQSGTIDNGQGTSGVVTASTLIQPSFYQQTTELERTGPTLVRCLGRFTFNTNVGVLDNNVLELGVRCDFGLLVADAEIDSLVDNIWDPAIVNNLSKGEWIHTGMRAWPLYAVLKTASGITTSKDPQVAPLYRSFEHEVFDIRVKRKLLDKSLYFVSRWAVSSSVPADSVINFEIDVTGRALLQGSF